MKKTTLKITALLLALLMMISLALVSCDKPLDDDGLEDADDGNNDQNGDPNDGENNDETSDPNDGENNDETGDENNDENNNENNDGDTVNNGNSNDPWLDKLGNHDLSGATINFAVAETTDNGGLNERSIEASAYTGDRVDTAIYNRNKNIEARFNCRIKLKFVQNDNLADTIVKNVLMSKGSEYDIIAGRQYDDIELCTVGDGLLIDLFANEDVKKHLSVTEDWWATEYIEGMAYNKKVYWLAGDLNLGYTGGIYAIFVNAKIYDNNFKNNESFGDIYQLVKDGRWTVDMMKTLSDLATTAVSNDPQPGNIPAGEVIGVAFPVHDNTNGLAVSCGVKFSTANPDGSVRFVLSHDNNFTKTFYKKYYELLATKGCVNYYGASEDGGYKAAFEDFAANKALFVPGRINHAERYLKNMDSRFYVIPNPKLNENQNNYISGVYDAISIYGISAGSTQIEASAIVLDAMAAESYRSVRPEYYDSLLKGKYTTDIATREMIDLISENTYTDVALAWSYTSYFGNDRCGNLGNFIRTELRDGVYDISTDLIINGIEWRTAISELDRIYSDNEN